MSAKKQAGVGQRFNQLLDDDNRQAQALLASSEWLEEEPVHQFRLCIKRLRAGWRMVRSPDYCAYRQAADPLLKAAAQTLGGKRDADVRLATWHRLRAGTGDIQTSHLDSLEALLQTEATAPAVTVEREALLALLRREAAIRADAQLARCRWRELKQGRQRAVKKNRQLAEQALKGQVDETFHRWRRWAKHLLYQRQLAASSRGRTLGERQQLLKQLGSELGRKHDLDMLAAFLAQSIRRPKQRVALEAIRPLVDATNRRHIAIIRDLYTRFIDE